MVTGTTLYTFLVFDWYPVPNKLGPPSTSVAVPGFHVGGIDPLGGVDVPFVSGIVPENIPFPNV